MHKFCACALQCTQFLIMEGETGGIGARERQLEVVFISSRENPDI